MLELFLKVFCVKLMRNALFPISFGSSAIALHNLKAFCVVFCNPHKRSSP